MNILFPNRFAALMPFSDAILMSAGHIHVHGEIKKEKKLS